MGYELARVHSVVSVVASDEVELELILEAAEALVDVVGTKSGVELSEAVEHSAEVGGHIFKRMIRAGITADRLD